jgi:hypothetical protein
VYKRQAALGSALNVRGGSIANIANSIFWGNTNSAISVTAQNNNGGLLFINYCNLQNGPDSVYLDSLSTLIWGPKNIDADPLFIDPLANDFHLSNLSPCIGHGTDSVWFPLAQLTAPKTDLDGILRPSPEGSDPDLGAYENLYGSPTHIEHTKKMEAEFALEQNYPNPFNPETKIRYSIPYGSLLAHNSTVDVKLTVFDILGREVQIIVNTKQNPGIYEITFNGRNLSSGLYFYELLAEGYRSVKKMMLIK